MSKKTPHALAFVTFSSLLTLLLALMGCVGGHYDQSTARQIEDSRTAERVREALAAGADYKYEDVKVVASNGVVQLTGFVDTSAHRNRAAEISRQVVGVKSVESGLVLKD